MTNGTGASEIRVMPYSLMAGIEQLKLALELAYVAPKIGGVLLSGQRGTGKSTVVRAFSAMVYGGLPVTLPINATEDRVVGGWKIDEMMRGAPVPQQGLLVDADGKMLYVDEVNLLDDHIVNIILDVTSTGVLVVERDYKKEEFALRFTLVGTMNPSEGGLRPQLLDRFGLMVDVTGETDDAKRLAVLDAVLRYDSAVALERRELSGADRTWLAKGRKRDAARRTELEAARERLAAVALPKPLALACVRVGRELGTEGHRGDYVLALAARAKAALDGRATVAVDDLVAVAPLALQHRRSSAQQGGPAWSPDDAARVETIARAGVG